MVQYSQLRTATLRSVFAGAYVVSCCSHCAAVLSCIISAWRVVGGVRVVVPCGGTESSGTPLDTRFGKFDGQVTTAVTSCVACLPHLSGESEDFWHDNILGAGVIQSKNLTLAFYLFDM